MEINCPHALKNLLIEFRLEFKIKEEENATALLF
jgi:hypothetical protein